MSAARRPGAIGRQASRSARHSGRSPVDPARRAAYDVLRRVGEGEAYANLVLPPLLRARGLAGRDAAFATELAYGTLRRRGTYDAVLAACVDRPLDHLDPGVLDVLRVGAHQLLGTRVAPHAAVSSTVDLARAVAGVGPARLVNAVLRRVGERDLEAWVARLAPAYDVDPLGHLALRESHPCWIVEALSEALGGDLGEVALALRADNKPPEVTLAARPGRSTTADLLAAGARPGRWSPYAAVLAGGDPGGVPAVHEGRAGVQDEGSQLVALALAAAPLDGPDARWLDLCAGPGGKAALLSGLATARGASLLATDRQPHRARLVAAALGDSGNPGDSGDVAGGRVITADGTAPAWPPATFDRVLVDVPCTGLGALRRRPEARWRRRPADLDALVPLQRALLGSALEAVRPGGVVAYVTCSPHPAETTGVRDSVLAGRSDIESVDARPLLLELPELGPGPDVQLWPHRHGTDAMYLALLRRLR